MAMHPSILAWKIPWTEEPGGAWRSQRVWHNWAHTHTHTHAHSNTHTHHQFVQSKWRVKWKIISLPLRGRLVLVSPDSVLLNSLQPHDLQHPRLLWPALSPGHLLSTRCLCFLICSLAITNLHSILKSRDITLTTKVRIIKAIVFPVVMFRCESWTIKKAEPRRTDAVQWWCWRTLLRVPWTVRRSNQSIPKEISPAYSLAELKLKLQYFGHLMRRADSLEKTLMLVKIEGRRRRGRQRMRWLDGIMDLKFEQILGDSGGQRNLGAAVHGVSKSRTQLSDWTITITRLVIAFLPRSRLPSKISWQSIRLQCRRPRFHPSVGKICWRRDKLPIPVFLGFPFDSSGKESACNVGDLGSIPGLGRSPGEGKGYSLQYSGLENPTDYIVQSVTAEWLSLHFTSKEQMSFNFMTAVTDCSDFGALENEICHCFYFSPFYLPWSDGTRCHDLSFLNAEF